MLLIVDIFTKIFQQQQRLLYVYIKLNTTQEQYQNLNFNFQFNFRHRFRFRLRPRKSIPPLRRQQRRPTLVPRHQPHSDRGLYPRSRRLLALCSALHIKVRLHGDSSLRCFCTGKFFCCNSNQYGLNFIVLL